MVIQKGANWESCSYVTFRDDWKFLIGLFSVIMASISRPGWTEKVTLYPTWIWILKSFQWKSKISNMTVTVIFLFLYQISIFFIYLSVRRRDWLMENNWEKHEVAQEDHFATAWSEIWLQMLCLECKERKHVDISKQKDIQRHISSVLILFSQPKMQYSGFSRKDGNILQELNHFWKGASLLNTKVSYNSI